jgi:hypothetical protein
LLSNRSGKQCRERYYHYLKPNLTKKVFTIDDDNYLNELQQKMGNKWNQISSCFEGCSQMIVKNRWYLINRCKLTPPPSLEFSTPKISELHSSHNDDIINSPVGSPIVISCLADEFDSQQYIPSLANIRSAFNFHRQDQYYKNRDPFIIPPSNWSPVLLRLGPEYIPIYKFDNSKRSVIWPKQTTTILTVDNIGFGLLWSILSEEFGWTHIPGKGCVNDLFRSPVQITQNNAHTYNFPGSSADDLRRHVKLYGLSGSNTLLTTTLFGFALSDYEGYKVTTLTISETLLNFVEEFKANTFVYSNECSHGYNCFCCGDPTRVSDGSSQTFFTD